MDKMLQLGVIYGVSSVRLAGHFAGSRGWYTNGITQFQQVEINIRIGNSSAEFKQEKLNLCLLRWC
jgi:hypothetical protein